MEVLKKVNARFILQDQVVDAVLANYFDTYVWRVGTTVVWSVVASTPAELVEKSQRILNGFKLM